MKKLSKGFAFVIHKHDATSLHFDFRLQVGSVMPSWAIPKGPTLDPTQKRLAMQTPDHAFSYRTFEGMLPEGSYGAGPVIIWDEGYYYPEREISKGVRETIIDQHEGTETMREGMRTGEIKFFLHGKRIKGSFALVKTKNFGPKNAWLLIKHRDKYDKEDFDAKDKKYDASVVSHKTLDDIREA